LLTITAAAASAAIATFTLEPAAAAKLQPSLLALYISNAKACRVRRFQSCILLLLLPPHLYILLLLLLLLQVVATPNLTLAHG
jgi:hypothetical protein